MVNRHVKISLCREIYLDKTQENKKIKAKIYSGLNYVLVYIIFLSRHFFQHVRSKNSCGCCKKIFDLHQKVLNSIFTVEKSRKYFFSFRQENKLNCYLYTLTIYKNLLNACKLSGTLLFLLLAYSLVDKK